MYLHKRLADFLGDRVVYRNLAPADPTLPRLADIWTEIGLETLRVPRKTEPLYAAAVYRFLQTAQAQRGQPPWSICSSLGILHERWHGCPKPGRAPAYARLYWCRSAGRGRKN